MIRRLIKTEQDYDRALSRIEGLMDARPGTAEMDELELLTALVEMYEERHFPVSPPDPIDAIKFRMQQLGLSQKDLVPYMGTKSKVSEVLNGRRPLTLAMMRSLNKGLGISAEVLLKEPGANFPNGMQDMDWSRYPLSEMAKRGWIPAGEDLKEKAEESMRPFIEQAGGLESVTAVFLRQGRKGSYNPKTDSYALGAWCLRVLSLARQRPLEANYIEGSVDLAAMQEVARLSFFDNGPLLAREYLAKHGIHLIVLPHLPRTYLDGAAILSPEGAPVIGLTLRYDRIDNFWFCLLHELAHVSKHLSATERLIVDDLDLRANQDETENIIENEANQMARDGLIPPEIWEGKPVPERPTIKDVNALAARLRIHPAIIAGRIRHEHNNYKLLSAHVGKQQIKKLFFHSSSAGTR